MNKRDKSTFLFCLFSVLITFTNAFVSAAPVDTADGGTVTLTFAGHTVTAHGIAFSVICFVTGAYLCFLGGVFQNFTIFVIGFYWGANIAYIILSNAKSDYGSNTDTILLVVSIVVGVLVGGLLTCCFFLAVYLLGGFFGYMAALWLLSWSSNGLIQSNWGRAILIIVFVIVGIILMVFLERAIFIIGTAFIGSFAIFCGIDVYISSGLLEMVNQMIHAKSLDVVVDASSKLRGMLGGCLALAIVGALIQWCMTRRRGDYTGWRERHPPRGGWRRV